MSHQGESLEWLGSLAIVRALEAKGHGFAHGHERLHSEPETKVIDIKQFFIACRSISSKEHEREPRADDHIRGVGSTEQLIEESLTSWMNAYREACLRDAATKQYDIAIKSAKQFGYPELKDVVTAENKMM